MAFNNQDEPIYSHDPREEELMIEHNSRYDYQAELAAEHFDPFADYNDCDEAFAGGVPYLRDFPSMSECEEITPW